MRYAKYTSNLNGVKISYNWNGTLTDRYDDRYMRSHPYRSRMYSAMKFFATVAYAFGLTTFVVMAWLVFNFNIINNHIPYLLALGVMVAVMYASLSIYTSIHNKVLWMVKRHRIRTSANIDMTSDYKNVTESAKDSVA